MPTKIAKSNTWQSYVFDAVAPPLSFDNVASVGAGVAGTTVQARLPVPTRMKIQKVCVNYSAIASASGNHQFNIVLGTGTYATGGTKAAASTTVTGTPNHDGTVTVTVNGHAVVYTEVVGDTDVATLLGNVVTAVNTDTTANKVVLASATSSALTLTALEPGTPGNSITVAIGSTDTAPLAFTTFGPNLTGGANDVATAIPDDTGRYVGALATALPGGIAVVSVGSNGQALFSTDQDLTNAADTPQVFIPTNYDGIIEQGTLLTLRCITPATTGSITNLKVTLVGCVVDPYGFLPAGYQQANWAVPSATTGVAGW